MFFSSTQVIIALLVVALAYFVARWLFRKDTERENRRRAAIKLAAKLQAVGLVRIPAFLEDIAVGDYSTAIHKIKQLAELFLSPGGDTIVMQEFEKVFGNLLEVKLATPEGRALIAAKLQEHLSVNDPAAVWNTPAPTLPATA